MRKKTFSEEQIALALRDAETGTPATEVCRKMGVSEQSFYRGNVDQLYHHLYADYRITGGYPLRISHVAKPGNPTTGRTR
jgi:putative transposase